MDLKVGSECGFKEEISAFAEIELQLFNQEPVCIICMLICVSMKPKVVTS
jgi:hypothetical protein